MHTDLATLHLFPWPSRSRSCPNDLAPPPPIIIVETNVTICASYQLFERDIPTTFRGRTHWCVYIPVCFVQLRLAVSAVVLIRFHTKGNKIQPPRQAYRHRQPNTTAAAATSRQSRLVKKKKFVSRLGDRRSMAHLSDSNIKVRMWRPKPNDNGRTTRNVFTVSTSIIIIS